MITCRLMASQRDMKSKIIFKVAPLVVIAASIAVISYLYFANHPTDNIVISGFDLKSFNASRKGFDKFQIEKLSLTKFKDGNPLVKLSAENVVHRKRGSTFYATYQNLKELHLSNVLVETYLQEAPGLSSPGRPEGLFDYGVFDNFGGLFEDMNKQRQLFVGAASEEFDDDELDIVTRVLFDGFSITMHSHAGKDISISAQKARMSDSDNIFLQGGVRVVDTEGVEYQAPEAVWSKKLHGIYYPSGYLLSERYYTGAAFFTVDSHWRFSKTDTTEIDYADPIEEKEKLFFGKIKGNSPLLWAAKQGLEGTAKDAKRNKATTRSTSIPH